MNSSTRIVLWFFVLTGIMAGRAWAADGTGKTDSDKTKTMLPKQQEEAFGLLGKFMDDLDEHGPYWKPGANVLDSIRAAEPMQQNLPFSQIIKNWASEGRLRFGQLMTANIPEAERASGLYDADTQRITLDEGTVGKIDAANKLITNPNTPPEARVTQMVQMISIAQSLVHEMKHAYQHEIEKEQPGAPENEAEAYRRALDATEAWVRARNVDFQKNPTLANAERLRAACVGWYEYCGNTQVLLDRRDNWWSWATENLPDRSVFRPWKDAKDLPAKTVQMDEIFAEATKTQRAIEILRSLVPSAGGSTATSGDDTVESLLSRLPPIHSKEALREFVEAKLQDAISQGFGPKSTKDNRIRSQKQFADNAVAGLEKPWRRRQDKMQREYDAALSRLRGEKLTLQVSLSDKELSPATPKITATVTVLPNLLPTVDKFLAAGEHVVGRRPIVDFIDTWTVDKQKPVQLKGMPPKEFQKEFTTPKEYRVKLGRQMNIRLHTPRQVPIDMALSWEAETAITIPGTMFPTNIAGQWTGKLQIAQIPFLHGSGGRAAPGTGGDAVSQGCGLPPEFLARLKQLEGKMLPLALDVKPSSVFAGKVTITVTPPKELGAQSKPITFPYRYSNNGTLTIEGVQDGASLKMTGKMTPANRGWTASGNWTSTTDQGGKRIPVANGAWTAANPYAN